MKINDRHFQSIWLKEGDPTTIQVIDQRELPHNLVIEDIKTVEQSICAIREMHVRGAPLIGAMAAYGIYLATLEAPSDGFAKFVRKAAGQLKKTRPTAIDLSYAVDRTVKATLKGKNTVKKQAAALRTAKIIAEESIEQCRRIGEEGLKIIKKLSQKKKGETVHILTHCNAGWLATVDFGTATAPIYLAHELGISVHVWVDETRPRNQGASLTAYELLMQGVPHTVIADNTGGHLMQHGMVDLVLVGSDRTTRTGDVANKIGTYLKALAAKDNKVPFYVALPSSSIDWNMRDGVQEIPIEERSPEEIRYIKGWMNGYIYKVLLTPIDSPAVNYGFDVTPARLVSGLITERGVCKASEKGLLALFPERKES